MTLPRVLPGQQNTAIIPSKTYEVDYENKRIRSTFVDGTDSIIQYLNKVFRTPRYKNLIYSFFYGHEIESLIGKSRDFIRSEYPRLVKDAIIYDDRIIGVTNFTMDFQGDYLVASCLVNTVFGPVTFEQNLDLS